MGMKNTTAKELVRLYNLYSNALIEAEQQGRGKYSDEDFNSLEGFIKFLRNNENNLNP